MIRIISWGVSNLENVEVLAKEEAEEAVRNKGSRMLTKNLIDVRYVEEGLYLLSFKELSIGLCLSISFYF